MKNRDKMRPIALIFAAAVLVIGTAVAWLIAAQTIDWVETSQQHELEQAFYAGGIDWAEASSDGFLVTISGETDSVTEQRRVLKIAGLIFGDDVVDATSVKAAPVTVAPEERPFVEILKNGNDFSFIGQMPKGETTRALALYIESLGREADVTNVTEPIETAPENWLPAFEFALRLAPLVDQAILNVAPGEVSLEAVAMSANWQQGFEEMAEKLRPEGVQLNVDISAPRPVIAPYTFVLDIADPSATVCAAQDEAEAARINKQIEQLVGLSVACEIGIGAPSRQWREAVEAGVTALAGLGGGRLEIIDADVKLTAPEDTTMRDFEVVAQALRTALPEGFTLQAASPEAPPRRAGSEELPIEFSASLSADGAAIIEGAVKDTLTREVVMRFSEAKFGYGHVEDRLWLDDTLPDGWQVRVFNLIEALALLNEGAATMTPDGIDIAGDASFEAPEAELQKLLESAYSADETTLEISYTEPKGGEEGRGLDPRLCVSRITKILSENSIVFAPSSAVIADPSIPTIEAIAALLTQCRDARIEIGGHTDSQGREEMNRNLSQARADAVLDALLAQNLLLGDLTAKGYGESEPIANNSTEEGRAANRRIEFKLLRDEPVTEPEAEAAPERVVIENFSPPPRRASQTESPANE